MKFLVSHYFRSENTTATIGLVIYLYNSSHLFVESSCINHYYMAVQTSAQCIMRAES